MTLKQFIDKYSNYIDDLKFKALHEQLVKSQDIFRLDDNVIEELNKLLLEEVGIDLLYEAEEDPNYVIITNGYCEDLCTRNDSPFVYKYKNKIDYNKSALELFNKLIDSNIHTLFDYIIDSDNDQISIADARDILEATSKIKSLELSLDYSSGRFQTVLDLIFKCDDQYDYITNNICFITNLNNNFGYSFSKSYWDSPNNKYAINDEAITALMKNIDQKILEALKK